VTIEARDSYRVYDDTTVGEALFVVAGSAALAHIACILTAVSEDDLPRC
jgi:hypothetical protein